MRVFVCVDRSHFSRSVIPAARRLARAAKADVDLVTVIVHPEPPQPEPWSGSLERAHEILEHEYSDEAKKLRQELAPAAAQFDPPARIVVLHGPSAADAIVHYARETRPDVIALATHSGPMEGDGIWGSTAREVTHSGVAPVLLLHPSGVELDPEQLPVGLFVFTADGQELGQVAEVAPHGFRVTGPNNVDVWLSGDEAEGITTGRLVLGFAAADLPERALRRP